MPSRKRNVGRANPVTPAAALSLAGVVLFLAISGGLAYRNIRMLREDNQKLVHSTDVITALDQLLSSAKDAETGQRGYLLTGDPNYVLPYERAREAIPGELDTLAALVRDDPAQESQMPALRQHVAAKLGELAATIALRRTQNLGAAMALVNTGRGKDQMEAIRAILASMSGEEALRRRQRLAEASRAYEAAQMTNLLICLLGVILAGMIGGLVRRATLLRQREEWLQAGQAGLSMAMLGDQHVEQLGGSILGFLADYLGAVAAALFVLERNQFQLAATYGVPLGTKLPERFILKEGLLGQAAWERRQMLLEGVPDDYLIFGTALGKGRPRHLVLQPAEADGNVQAVLELGFIHAVEARVLNLLERTAPAIALAVRAARYRAELHDLLQETERKSEALQVQGEELRVSNEELEEQGRMLKESQARLEQQQLELEETNGQLEETTQQVKAQRDDLARANAAVELKARELEQASRYKSHFLANMSHELRTPLNASLILAKLLADNPQGNLTAEQVKYARTIQASGHDLLNLINDILDLSKIEAGHVELRAEPVSLSQLAANMRELFEPVAREKGLQFEVEIAPGTPVFITADAQRLQQVLRNLLANAIKFTAAGKVALTLRRADAGGVEFRVSDTGVGIPEAQQQAVFEAFHQADSTISREYGGTGLGLSISRELVRMLGGTIGLRSRPGEGSIFTVIVPEEHDPGMAFSPPLTEPLPAEKNPDSLAQPSQLPSGPAFPPTSEQALGLEDDRDPQGDTRRALLIIEDDAAFAGILRDLCREMGFKSLVAANAEEALDLARQFLPSAVVLDIGLPDQSGLVVLDQLKRDVQTRHIPVHVVSASDHTEAALALGAVGHLVKPVRREDLVAMLARLEDQLSQRMRRVLIVEDDRLDREAVARLLSARDVETVSAGTAAECLARLKEAHFDCMVLDLSLPDATGFSLLETLSQSEEYSFPPVIVYTGQELTADEEQKLRRYSKSIIIKGAKSPERLLDEVSLFLHQVVADLPPDRQRMIRRARSREAALENRRILVVEDDVRNVYALTNILEPHGVRVEIARNGQEALGVLRAAAREGRPIDLVLMDVMMPVMDGLTATREIRRNPDWRRLPIIMLTAKAMPDDQQLCIEAGANDYMAKPLDVEKLLSLVQVWMPR